MSGSTSPEVAHLRGKHAALCRRRAADDPEVVETSRDLKAAALGDHIRRLVDAPPPLTSQQRRALAALLVPARDGR